MSPFDFFQLKQCLTMGGVEWEHAKAEFRSVGLFVEKFDSIPDIGPHQSFNRSFRGMVQKFFDSGKHNCLLVEDDCEFRRIDTLWPALQELPEDWDIVYLGCNIQSDAKKVTDRVYKITNAWCTHAVGMTRKIAGHILNHQPDFSAEMVDNWLGSQLIAFNAYVVKPMVAYQRPRMSKIWGKFVDYNEVFIKSEKKMA